MVKMYAEYNSEKSTTVAFVSSFFRLHSSYRSWSVWHENRQMFTKWIHFAFICMSSD